MTTNPVTAARILANHAAGWGVARIAAREFMTASTVRAVLAAAVDAPDDGPVLIVGRADQEQDARARTEHAERRIIAHHCAGTPRVRIPLLVGVPARHVEEVLAAHEAAVQALHPSLPDAKHGERLHEPGCGCEDAIEEAASAEPAPPEATGDAPDRYGVRPSIRRMRPEELAGHLAVDPDSMTAKERTYATSHVALWRAEQRARDQAKRAADEAALTDRILTLQQQGATPRQTAIRAGAPLERVLKTLAEYPRVHVVVKAPHPRSAQARRLRTTATRRRAVVTT